MQPLYDPDHVCTCTWIYIHSLLSWREYLRHNIQERFSRFRGNLLVRIRQHQSQIQQQLKDLCGKFST